LSENVIQPIFCKQFTITPKYVFFNNSERVVRICQANCVPEQLVEPRQRLEITWVDRSKAKLLALHFESELGATVDIDNIDPQVIGKVNQHLFFLNKSMDKSPCTEIYVHYQDSVYFVVFTEI